MMSKIDNRSSCESGSAILSADQRQINKSGSDLQSRHHKQHQYQHSQSSLLNENENLSNLPEEGHMSTNKDSVYIIEEKSIKQKHNVKQRSFLKHHFRIFANESLYFFVRKSPIPEPIRI